MPRSKHIVRLIGRREYVDFPLLELAHIEAKIDTGAYTSSIHCEDIFVKTLDGVSTLYFSIQIEGLEKRNYTFTDFTTKNIRNSFGEMEERYIIRTILKIGKKNIWVAISLSNRDKMRYPVLIGRKPLKGKFLIDVKQLHLGGQKVAKGLKQHILK